MIYPSKTVKDYFKQGETLRGEQLIQKIDLGIESSKKALNKLSFVLKNIEEIRMENNYKAFIEKIKKNEEYETVRIEDLQ